MSILDEGYRQGGRSRTRPHGNLHALRLAVIAMFAILTGRLVYMQLVEGDSYAQRSRENHITAAQILPPRGMMTDRNGTPLVKNVPVYTAVLTPQFLPDTDNARKEIYLALESLLGVPALQIQQMVREKEDEGRPDLQIQLLKYLTEEQALRLEELSVNMPGVTIDVKPGRQYVAGDAFSHILGYVGDQTAENRAHYAEEGYLLNEPVGLAGLESEYESDLRGKAGISANEQDAHGNLIEVLESTDPEPGNNLVLAIDANLQNFVAQTLQDNMKDARNAAAVVMNAKTGEVYSIVSIPTYDNNIFTQLEEREAEYSRLLDDSRKPFLNWALSPAAPGSTFKLVTAAAGLQEGSITTSTSQWAPKVLEVKGENDEIYDLVDWRAHGWVNFYSGIAWSSNIFFFRTSCGILGESRGLSGKSGASYEDGNILAYYARAFGFGQSSGIDIAGEDPGRVPTPQWKKEHYAGSDYTDGDRDWYYADTCFTGIGQGDMLASPIQIARMTAAVANGGTLVTPHVAKSVVSPDGDLVREIEPETKKVPVDADYLAAIREGMHQSVIYGAGAAARSSSLDIAGKTGTAEFKKNGVTYQHAWFTGFYPFNDPEIVVTVYFDLGIGGEQAAPVAKKILEYFNQNVTP